MIDFNPWPARRAELDAPDELRVDLDPGDGVGWDDVRRVALVVRDVLEEHGLRGYPKTSGSKGIHVMVRLVPEWDFLGVRRAALALAREVERRAPDLATSKWWKEERHGVFVDYNQNARDRTVASCYSVRPTVDARVSCALEWDEVADVEPGDLRLDTVPERLKTVGDPAATIDDNAGTLDGLLELARRDEEEGIGDAPGRRTSRSREASPSASSRAATRTARPSAAAPATRSPAARRPASEAATSKASAPSPAPARATRTSSTTDAPATLSGCRTSFRSSRTRSNRCRRAASGGAGAGRSTAASGCSRPAGTTGSGRRSGRCGRRPRAPRTSSPA